MGKQRAGSLSTAQERAIYALIGVNKPTDNSFCRWLENKHQIPAGTVRAFMRTHDLEFADHGSGGRTIQRVSVLV